jgi:hypothetical protein
MDLRQLRAVGLALPIAVLVVASVWIAPSRAVEPGASSGADVATTYVVGYLERLGDASSFVRRCDWPLVVAGRGRTTRVALVVVSGDAPVRRLATAAAVLDAQSRGELYVIDTFRTVPRGASLGLACAARGAPPRG